MGNFVKDLRDAKVVELEVATILELGFDTNSYGEGAVCTISQGKVKEFDFVLTRPPIRYELKWDRMAKDSKCVAVEYECRGKPSGISVTKADIILYKLDGCGVQGEDILVETRTDDLKQLLADMEASPETYKSDGYRKVVGGDYGSKTKLVLVPIFEFVHAGDIIHTWKKVIKDEVPSTLSPSIDVV